MQPLDTELNEISFSDGGVTAHLFSKRFTYQQAVQTTLSNIQEVLSSRGCLRER